MGIIRRIPVQANVVIARLGREIDGRRWLDEKAHVHCLRASRGFTADDGDRPMILTWVQTANINIDLDGRGGCALRAAQAQPTDALTG